MEDNQTNALDMFYTKRIDTEPDVVGILSRDLTTFYHEHASDIFNMDNNIINVKDLNPISQRIIVNKWIVNKLLTYRTYVDDKDVSEIVLHAINDGTILDWTEQMQRVVIPFFKLRNVLFIEALNVSPVLDDNK